MVTVNKRRRREGGMNMRQVFVYQGEHSPWVAECPSLPGCISQGKTKKDAIANINVMIGRYIAALREGGSAVSDDRFETVIVPDRGELDRGTLRAILKQASRSVDDFPNLL
jgi:predicted RNase H-like HicB family nuclease